MSKIIKELKGLTDEELNSRVVELRKEMIKLNAQVATGTPPKNPMEIRNIKKTVAVIFTLLNERKLQSSIKKIEEDKKA